MAWVIVWVVISKPLEGMAAILLFFGLVGTPARPLTSLGIPNPRSQSPFVEETTKGCSMTEMGHQV